MEWTGLGPMGRGVRAASPVPGPPPSRCPARTPRAGSPSPTDTSSHHPHDWRPGRSPDVRVRAARPLLSSTSCPRLGTGKVSSAPFHGSGPEARGAEWQDQGCPGPCLQQPPGPATSLGTRGKAADTRPTSQQFKGKRDFSLGLRVGYYNEESFFKKSQGCNYI